METVITVKKLNKFTFSPASIIEEISQNICLLLSTVKGSVTLDRNLGLQGDFIDDPTPRAIMKFRIYITELIKEYEPRVEVKKIIFENVGIGDEVKIRLEVNILDEFIK